MFAFPFLQLYTILITILDLVQCNEDEVRACVERYTAWVYQITSFIHILCISNHQHMSVGKFS